MATQVNGYRKLLAPQYDTYNHWKEYALSHGVNVDWSFGNQCWDICALLWFQYGLKLETGNGYAYGCYALKRDVNAKFPFVKVERVVDIKKGDILCFWPSGLNYTGHICFADDDYKDRYFDVRTQTWKLNCLGQNQGQGTGNGIPSNIVGLTLTRFCGGFRNTQWKPEEPEPVAIDDNSRKLFPWAIYSRKFRNKRK